MMTHVLPPPVNPGLAAAVAAFAGNPSPQTRFHVLRWCMYGSLILGSPGTAGQAEGPDGEPALIASTSGDGSQRPSVAVLEQAVAEGYRWLLLDPAGPSCALARPDLGFALHGDRNDAVRAALGDRRDSRTDRLVTEALAGGGYLLLGVDPTSISGSGEGVRLRSAHEPDGDVYLFAYTSGPEGVSRHASDSFASRPVEQVLGIVVDGRYAGLAINPSGPSATLSAADCRQVLARLGR